MKKIFAIIIMVFVSMTIHAQNDPFGIGTYNPQANLHIHSTTEPSNGGGGGLVPLDPPREGVFQTNYVSSFQMTNPNSGADATDGFRITLYNWDVNMILREAGCITINNNSHRFHFTNSGQLGVGDTSGNYKLYVYGTSGFDGNVSMSQGLSVQGNVSVNGITTLDKLITHTATNIYGKLIAHGRILADSIYAVNSLLRIGSNTTMNRRLKVDGLMIADSNMVVGGELSVGSHLTVDGRLTVGNGLFCDAQGNMKVKHLRVTLSDWPDYVFTREHSLMPLCKLEAYIGENSHLPGVPTAEEVERNGADLGEMNKLLMEKVEELTLYIIDLQKQIDELKSNR